MGKLCLVGRVRLCPVTFVGAGLTIDELRIVDCVDLTLDTARRVGTRLAPFIEALG